jgi:peroxiredoxin
MVLNYWQVILLSITLLFCSCTNKDADVPVTPVVPEGKAPDFTLPTLDNQLLALSDLRGKVVLLDIWASWCSYCKAENPNVEAAYTTYNTLGFEVFAVSIDNKKENWIKSITEQQLSFTHVIDTLAWESEVVDKYNVKRIPHLVLIDREGKIVASADSMIKLKLQLMQLFDDVKIQP